MIEERHTPTAEDINIRLPLVNAWTPDPVCPKCGHRTGGGVRLIRWLFTARGIFAHNYLCSAGETTRSSVSVAGDEMRPNGLEYARQRFTGDVLRRSL